MHTKTSSKTIVVTLGGMANGTTYASGDVIGAITTIPNAVLDEGGTCVLQSVCFTDKAAATGARDILIFNDTPTSSIGADDAAYQIADADLTKLIARVSLVASDFKAAGANSEATKVSVGLVLKSLAKSKDLYFAMVARSTPTTVATGDYQVRFGFLQD